MRLNQRLGRMLKYLKRKPVWIGAALLLGLGALAAGWMVWRLRYGARSAGTSPPPLASPETPVTATAFDFPLDPADFGPYIPHVSGPLAVDTRFGAQNPGVGGDGKCFVDLSGARVAFNRLYHAGEDWFGLDAQDNVRGRAAAGAPVRAVANGVVSWSQSLGAEGYVLIVEHRLPPEAEHERVWSIYWHVADVTVAVGEAVARGQAVGRVHDRGLNSHLHWEIRAFADGSDLFPPESAGGRGTCNGYRMAVGYTWDDAPDRARPEAWGYLDPVAFVEAHRK